MTTRSNDFRKRDRLVLSTVMAHVPLAGIVGACFGHLLVGAAIAVVAALLCWVAFAATGGTRAFRACAGALLMIDSAALIAASGGQTAVHFHVFIVITFLILYFDWLPIVAATATIALHHVIGNWLFPQLVFGDMGMGNSWVMVVIHAVAVVIESAAAVYVAMRIRNSVTAISSVASIIADEQIPYFRAAISAVADGNLTHALHFELRPVSLDQSDEIGMMAVSFNQMQAEIAASVEAFEETRCTLRDIVGAMKASATKLTGASNAFAEATGDANAAVESISLASESVAAGTSAQAGQIEGASNAIAELARSASAIASGAADQTNAVRGVVAEVQALDGGIAGVTDRGKQMTSFVQLATIEASSGIAAVIETENAVIQLREQLAANTTLMSSLESRSGAVKEIVKTIGEIAEQTNLLALNAAIEAARAGEQGRGFAVVANEVRKLAERSATSTREISQILENIRTETVEAANSMRISSSSMDNGLILATRAKGALETLGAKIDETSRVATAMLAGAESMSAASTRATANVESVSSIISQNAAAAAQVGSTTAHVAETLVAVRSTSQAQSNIAGDVSTSVLTLASRVAEMHVAADNVRSEAQVLSDIVGRFRIEAHAAKMPPARGRALMTTAAR